MIDFNGVRSTNETVSFDGTSIPKRWYDAVSAALKPSDDAESIAYAEERKSRIYMNGYVQTGRPK